MAFRPRRWPALVPILAALACSPLAWGPAWAPARATEQARMEPLWIVTVAPDGEAGHTALALLTLPPGWMFGDAAALVLADGPWPGLARQRLMSALLGEGAAVLELDVAAGRQTVPAPTTAELALDARAAVQALRRDTGAGLVVALGYGEGGTAAMALASMDRAVPEPDGGGTAAAASLGPEKARFALGGAAPGRGWPVRAERLCGVLAFVADVPGARPDAECLRALLGPGEPRAMRLAGP